MTEVTRERQPFAGGDAERRPEPRPSSAAGRLHRTPRVRPQSRRVTGQQLTDTLQENVVKQPAPRHSG
jgi:hypothetical protein